ncbi:DsbA family protein [Sporolactobacillus sp. CPB3-1]|uniref:ClpXP adapter protein SpxH n=1 Tax=Sporolactobacillus mangiferae TaxID=2940498 RepID=A0ABT0M8W4_9BACL|nr:DsbA family protein [Sporolactobacillus mangiferae]MCL1631033.1 DsbA family protein [Sporolactobacillus mangiferae]
MTYFEKGTTCEGTPGNEFCTVNLGRKRSFQRVEILAFIDPLCPECWGFEPLIKKFMLQYHDYVTLRVLLTTRHDTANRCQFHHAKKIAEEWDKYARLTGMCCDSDVWLENPPSPYAIAYAIKAAEFQGRAAGLIFLRRVREQIFLRKQGLNLFEELLDVARLSGLNEQEFSNDYHSCRPIKAFQCDRKLANEMAITELPTLVFSTPCNDSEAIKVNGQYPYSVYVEILTDLLGEKPVPRPNIPISAYIEQQRFLTTKEVAVVYDLTEEAALKELRKLQLQQIIEPIVLKSGEYWSYILNAK